MSSLKLTLLSAILLVVQLQVSTIQASDNDKLNPKFVCSTTCADHPNVTYSRAVGCLNGFCQCKVGSAWNLNSNTHKYYCGALSCDNCTKFNLTCNSGACGCPKGTTLAEDRLRCPPDLPPFGPKDKPPGCTTPHFCDDDYNDDAICHKDKHCRCKLGYDWYRPAEEKPSCKEITCTTTGKECAVMHGVCHESACICSEHYSKYTGQFIEKCHLNTTFVPYCKSTVDCSSGRWAVSGSVCYKNKCSCKFGFERYFDACIKTNCTENHNCPGLSHCDKAKRTCVCNPLHHLGPNGVACTYDNEPMANEFKTEFVSANVFIIFGTLVIIIVILVAMIIFCFCTGDDQAEESKTAIQPYSSRIPGPGFQPTGYSKQQSKVLDGSALNLQVSKQNFFANVLTSKSQVLPVSQSKDSQKQQSKVLDTEVKQQVSKQNFVNAPTSPLSKQSRLVSGLKLKASNAPTESAQAAAQLMNSQKLGQSKDNQKQQSKVLDTEIKQQVSKQNFVNGPTSSLLKQNRSASGLKLKATGKQSSALNDNSKQSTVVIPSSTIKASSAKQGSRLKVVANAKATKRPSSILKIKS